MIFNRIKNLFKSKRKYEYINYAVVSKKDKSGRYRYNLYINGKLSKEELTIEGWYKKEIK